MQTMNSSDEKEVLILLGPSVTIQAMGNTTKLCFV
jgi:hypothetical protein